VCVCVCVSVCACVCACVCAYVYVLKCECEFVCACCICIIHCFQSLSHKHTHTRTHFPQVLSPTDSHATTTPAAVPAPSSFASKTGAASSATSSSAHGIKSNPHPAHSIGSFNASKTTTASSTTAVNNHGAPPAFAAPHTAVAASRVSPANVRFFCLSRLCLSIFSVELLCHYRLCLITLKSRFSDLPHHDQVFWGRDFSPPTRDVSVPNDAIRAI
jgi:hypothetical protein